MIKIKSITVSNFMSISKISLTFPEGVTELKGANLDSDGANGTGKSSLLLSISQCLFNKNPHVGLQKVNNTITGKPYQIILEVEVGDDYYIIDNNRGRNKIIIKKNGEIVTSRIKESLLYIETEILNLTYSEFIALTFITSHSLKSIFDITSANLLLKLFSLHKIDEYVNTLKMERRVISRELSSLRATKQPQQVQTINELNVMIKEVTDELTKLKFSYDIIEQERINFNNERLIELQHIKETNAKGICPTCGQVVPIQEYDEMELAYLLNLKEDTESKSLEVHSKIVKLESQVRLLEARRVAVLEVQQEVHTDNTELRKELTKKSDIINNTLKIIDQGTVHQVYLNQFLRVLNTNLLSNRKGNFNIKAKLINSSISYEIKTDGHIKDIEQLSGGESTTIALIILTSIYTTLKQLLDIDINLLILDEAIHMVDDGNKEFISDLIKDMNKNVIVVQHKENINPRIFNGTITIIKEKGIATLKTEALNAS